MAVQTHVYDAPFALGRLFCKQPGLSGPVVSGQLRAGFGCHQVTWEIRLFSKPHQGGPLQFNPEPQPELGKRCRSSKTDVDRRTQNKKGDHKSHHRRGDPPRPPLKNQVLFSSYMSKEGSRVENSLSYTRLRGDRELRWKKWPPGEGTRSTDLLGHQASPPPASHVAWRKEGELPSKHHTSQICDFILGSYHEKNSESSGIPPFKQL